MNIKADRDVLYFAVLLYKKMINLQTQKEASRHNKNCQNRGYSYPLLKGYKEISGILQGHGNYLRGSLTVEASFCATAFFLALFSLLYLFQMLAGINQIQMRLASAAWQYECFGTKLGTVEGLLKQSVLIQWNEKEEICFVKERVKIPFLGANIFQVSLYQQMKINNYKGRSMVSENRDIAEYVYIAENGRVYHTERGCVYLNPEIRSMGFQTAMLQRNSSGAKYKLCKSCGQNIVFTESTTVYITPFGDSYHATKNCSGLKRTIHKVKRSETGKMGACSKCN
jgi:hypothetical protein